MEPTVTEAYGRMLKRVTFALDKAWIFAIFAGFGCGIGYVATLRIMTDVRRHVAQRLPHDVRADRVLQSRPPARRAPDLQDPAQVLPGPGSSVMDFIRMIVLAGLILFGLMALTR